MEQITFASASRSWPFPWRSCGSTKFASASFTIQCCRNFIRLGWVPVRFWTASQFGAAKWKRSKRPHLATKCHSSGWKSIENAMSSKWMLSPQSPKDSDRSAHVRCRWHLWHAAHSTVIKWANYFHGTLRPAYCWYAKPVAFVRSQMVHQSI